MLPSEAAMLEQFQVGRWSLREALRILEVQGLLTLKPGPGGGPIVSEPGSAAFARLLALHCQVHHVHYRELVEARLALEPLAARMAAAQADESSAAVLHSHLAEVAAIPDAEYRSIIEHWADFHYLVGSLSGNGLLGLLTRALGELYHERVVLREQAIDRLFNPEGRARNDDAHAQITAAISAGRTARAERLMRDHMAELSAGVSSRNPKLMDDMITWG
jgi:DNA-binding FadR family transcriptional regulator